MSSPAPSPSPSPWRHSLLTLAVFVVLTGYFTYPLWTDPAGQLNELWDVRLNTWIMAWDAHALVTRPASLFDANIFYPHARTLAFSENLLGSALLVAPINWAGQPILAYNLILLSGFILCGVAMALWVRDLTGSVGAGLVAGVVWAFAPSKMDHSPQIQLLTGQWIVFGLVALTRYARTGRRGFLLAGALLIGWQYLAGIQITLLMLPGVAIYTVALCLARGTWTRLGVRRAFGDLAIAAVIGAVLIVPVSLPYLTVSDAEGFVRQEQEVQRLSAQPKGYLSPSPLNRAAHMRWLHERYRLTEANHFPGIVALTLFLAGAIWLGVRAALRRRPSPNAPGARVRSAGLRAVHRVSLAVTLVAGSVFVAGLVSARWPTLPGAESVVALGASLNVTVWVALSGAVALLTRGRLEHRDDAAIVAPVALYLAVLGFLLSLGLEVRAWSHDFGVGPYRLLYDYAMPYRSIRAAGRFGLAALPFAALLVGIVVARLQRVALNGVPVRHRRLAVTTIPALLLILMAAEYRTTPFPAENARVPDPEVYDHLAALQGDGSILHIPVMRREYPPSATEYMLGSTRHWRSLVNGFSGFLTPEIVELNSIAPFTPEFFEVVRRDFDVDYIVMHGHQISAAAYEGLGQRARAATRELTVEREFDNSVIYRLRARVERGFRVRRRYPVSKLPVGSRIAFEARALGSPADTILDVSWNQKAMGRFRLTSDWQRFEVARSAMLQPYPDGTVSIRWRSLKAGIPLARTGATLVHDLLIDVQPDVIALGVDDEWIFREESGTAIVAVFTDAGSSLVESRVFGAEPSQLEAFVAFLGAIEPRSIVVVGYRDVAAAGPAIAAKIAAALGAIGSSVRAESLPNQLAVVGVQGAAPGTAAEDRGAPRAAVRVGPMLLGQPRFGLRAVELRPPG